MNSFAFLKRIGEKKLLLLLLFIEAALAWRYCAINQFFEFKPRFKDGPSYLLFDFTSLESVFGGHRTFGLPLIMKAFSFFNPDYSLWPFFQGTLYLLSIVFLGWSLFRLTRSFWIALIAATYLFYNWEHYIFFPFFMTEPIGELLMNVALGLVFISVASTRVKHIALVLSGLIVFYLPITRPAMVSAIPAFLVCFVFLEWAFAHKSKKNTALAVAVFSLSVLVPFSTYLALKYKATRQLTIVSMTGGLLSGHAGFFLTKEIIPELSKTVQPLATELLLWKSKLYYPCNVAPLLSFTFLKRMEAQRDCYNDILISAWTLMVYKHKGFLPLVDKEQNYMADKYASQALSAHYSHYDYKMDRELLAYSKEILEKRSSDYFIWLVYGSLFGITQIYLHYSRGLHFCLYLFLATFLLSKVFKVRPSVDRPPLSFKKKLALSSFGVVFFFISFVPIVLVNTTHYNFFQLATTYLIPSLWLLAFQIRYKVE